MDQNMWILEHHAHVLVEDLISDLVLRHCYNRLHSLKKALQLDLGGWLEGFVLIQPQEHY